MGVSDSRPTCLERDNWEIGFSLVRTWQQKTQGLGRRKAQATGRHSHKDARGVNVWAWKDSRSHSASVAATAEKPLIPVVTWVSMVWPCWYCFTWMKYHLLVYIWGLQGFKSPGFLRESAPCTVGRGSTEVTQCSAGKRWGWTSPSTLPRNPNLEVRSS